jgi:peptide deformylase
MSILKVARMGHPVLREVAREVDPTTVRSPASQKLIDDMIDTMVEYDGIGLAAPQVHESVRLFVAGVEGSGDDLKIVPFVNPVITPVGTDVAEDWEGCLSIPDIRGRVPRARQILVRAYDRRGKRVELKASGFTARVIQHETDHLDGVLFFDRMKSFETLTFLDEFGRYWTGPGVDAVKVE